MVWIGVFHLHYEWNGSAYVLISWPEDKQPLEQNNLIMEIFQVIKSELIGLINQKKKNG